MSNPVLMPDKDAALVLPQGTTLTGQLITDLAPMQALTGDEQLVGVQDADGNPMGRALPVSVLREDVARVAAEAIEATVVTEAGRVAREQADERLDEQLPARVPGEVERALPELAQPFLDAAAGSAGQAEASRLAAEAERERVEAAAIGIGATVANARPQAASLAALAAAWATASATDGAQGEVYIGPDEGIYRLLGGVPVRTGDTQRQIESRLPIAVPAVGPCRRVRKRNGLVVEAWNRDGRFFRWNGVALVEAPTVEQAAANAAQAFAAAPRLVPAVGHRRSVRVTPSGKVYSYTNRDGSRWQWDGTRYARIDAGAAGSPIFATDWTTGTTWPLASLLADPDVVFGFGVNGQSFVHEGGDDATPYSTTPLHPGYALMPASGPRPDGGTVVPPVDLREVAPYETPFSGAADVIMTRLQARLGFKPRIVFFAHSLGGSSYTGIGQGAGWGIKRGTVRYNEGLRIIRELTEYYRGLGKRFVVLWDYRLHGERDSGNPDIVEWTFRRILAQSEMDWQEDVPAITGQTTIIRRLVQQHIYGSQEFGGRRDVAQAQFDIQRDSIRQRCVGASPDIRVGAPKPDGDPLHPIPRSKADMGRQAGHYAIQDLAGPGEACMHVVAAWWINATKIGLEYTHPIALEADDTRVVISTLGAGKGVDFTDGSGVGVQPTVTGIAVSATESRVLEVTLSSPPVGRRPRLHISARQTNGGATGWQHGPRSAIRRADPIVTATAYYDTDVFAWAVSETVDL